MIMFFTPVFPPKRPEKPIRNYGDLVDFLSQFPRDHSIALLGSDGKARYDVHIAETGMSTVLLADGEEVEW